MRPAQELGSPFKIRFSHFPPRELMRLPALLGASDPPMDPRDTENRAAIDALVSETIITREAAHWIERFAGVQVPCVPIQNIAEMMDDEQVKAIGIMQPEPESGVSSVGMPFNVNGERPQIRKVASTLEEATQARAQVEIAVAAGESPFEKLFG